MLYSGQELYLAKNGDGKYYVVFDHEEYGTMKYYAHAEKNLRKARALLNASLKDSEYFVFNN